MILIACGGVIFLLPGMVSRFLFSGEVAAMQMDNPAEAAYAVAALNVLPNGLTGILVAAMMAATMSSMDTGLNANTGAIVNNLIPAIRRQLGLKPLDEVVQVNLCKFVTLILGLIIISFALLWATEGKVDIFGSFMLVQSMIVVPVSFPFAISIFIKQLPRWGFFFILGSGLLPSIIALIDEHVYGNAWLFQDRLFWVLGCGITAMLISIPFYKTSSHEYRNRIDRFFKRIRTPIDFEEEVKGNLDKFQLKFMGTTALIGGAALSLLLLVPNTLGGRIGVLFIAGFVTVVGLILRRSAK